MRPGFDFCMGEGPKGGAAWLRGKPAMQALYAWADIPRSLLEKWCAERRATA